MLINGCQEGKGTPRLTEVKCPKCGGYVEVFVLMGGPIGKTGTLANDDVSLSIEKGEVFALVGENGAGKSTLMNQLYGMYPPTSGEILVNGKKVVMDNPKKAIEAAGLELLAVRPVFN